MDYLAFDRQYWFEMQVGTAAALAPRIPLTASPYSLDKRSGGGAGDGHSLDAADGSPTDALFVDNDGNVGIGTTRPDSGKLEVSGNISISAPGDGGDSFVFEGASDASRFAGSKIKVMTNGPSGWGIGLFTTPDDGRTLPERVRIDGSGNVGIGTTNPGALLDLRSDAVQNLNWGSLTAKKGVISWGGNGANVRGAAGIALQLGSDDVDGRLTIATNGNVGIGRIDPAHPLHMASGAHVTTGGVWTNASDQNLKENFVPVDDKALLEKIDQLPIWMWNYKLEGAPVKHIGPTGQDFYRIFGLGHSDTSISTIDPAGIALAAIQELKRENDALAAENEALRARLSELETVVKSLVERLPNTQKAKGDGETEK